MPATPPPAPVQRYPELESLRGLMAWLVVSSHVLAQAGYHDRPLPRGLGVLRNGGLGIEVFIILSGFVIFHLLTSRPEPYGTFLFRRAVRLYPAYLLGLAAGIVLSFSAVHILDALPWVGGATVQVIRANWVASQAYFAPHVLLHLSLLHGLLPNEVLPYSSSAFLDVAWSLSLEWQFYLVAPALLWAFLRYRSVAVLVFAGAVVACVRVQPYFGDFYHAGRLLTWHLKSFLPLMIQLFAVGIGSFYLLRWLRLHLIALPRYLMLFVAAGAYVLDLPLCLAVWGVVLAVVASTGSAAEDPATAAVRALLRSPPLQYFGKTSYSTYLLHTPVIYAATWLLERFDLIHGPAQFAVTLGGLTVGGVALVSYFSYHWVEQPPMDWVTRRFRRVPAPLGVILPFRS